MPLRCSALTCGPHTDRAIGPCGIVFPIHLFTFAVAAFAMTAVTMITHCGYRLPVYDSLFAHAAGHDLHYSKREPTNVSVVLSLCDRLFGTYQPASYRPARSS